VRRLLKPEEVTALSPRTAITFTPGVPPLKTTLIRYYEEKIPAAGRPARLKSTTVAWCVLFLAVACGFTGAVSDITSSDGGMQTEPGAHSIGHMRLAGNPSKPRTSSSRAVGRSNQRAFNETRDDN
jgi:type IV secretion system protein VirD4